MENKTKKQLVAELAELRQRIVELEAAETDRREAEELYRNISEKTWTAIYVVQDGIFQLINSRGATYVGYTPEELIGRKSISIIHPEDREMAAKNSVAMLKGKQTSPYEFRVITKNGGIRWIIETTTSINYKGKRAILGNSIDITERKQAENVIREKERFFTSVLDEMITFLAVLKPDGEIVFVNNAPLKVIGKSLEQVRGMKFYNVDWWTYSRDIQQLIKEDLERCASGENIYHEVQIRTRDGDTWIDFNMHPIFGEDGSIQYLIPEGRDITERKQTEEALRESEEKYHSLISTEDFMYLVDRDCRYLFVNQRYRERYGLDLNEITKKTYADLHSGDQVKDFSEGVAKVFETGESIQSEVKSINDGKYYLKTLSPVRGKDGEVMYVTVVAKDITDRKRAEEELIHMATHDYLTGLSNRALFNDRLAVELARARRNPKKLAVMLLDLDEFKEINDTLGHSFGDKLLKAVAKCLSELLRESDTVARMGGDEFLLLLSEFVHVNDVVNIAQKILDTIRKPLLVNGHELNITTSLGIAVYPEDGRDANTLIKNADIAMYNVKKHGRNGYQIYSSNFDKKNPTADS